ncbi:MAG: beta-lactamase family protein, partial [Muribaculaceae bacterium]|nr:beta-lactamase family protein [Muribaculaceae bacterium]
DRLQMKRSDIRKSTIYIISFSILFFIFIHLFSYFRSRGEEVKEVASAVSPRKGGVVWSDTLSNHSSAYTPLQKMDAEIQRFMQKWEVKGMSLAVMRNDSLLYAKGYGYADMESGEKMDASSVMRIASASKLVTAIAIMKLVEDKRLRLDSKVFGPEGILNDTSFTASIGDQRIRDITVDHLLQHKGGFGRGAGDPMFNTREIIAAKGLSGAPDNNQLTRIVLGRRLAFQPGNGRRYSNFGYMLLSLVIEKVTGKSYWDYVKEEVLEPAGAWKFRAGGTYFEDRTPGEVKYYAPDNELVEEYNGSGRMVSRVYGGSNIPALLGAGGWVTSAPDLARLVAATDGYAGVKDVLSRESIGILTEDNPDDKSCRGWVDVEKGIWRRTGTLSSTHSLIEKFPQNDCWVIITNSGNWKGHHFNTQLQHLIDNLRSRYGASFPSRSLW